MNQQYQYFDMILTSTIMTILSSQITLILNELLSLLGTIIKIFLIFFQKIIVLIFAGRECKSIVIDDFNPLFDVIDKNLFNNDNIIWWSSYYKKLNNLKNKLQTSKITNTATNKQNTNISSAEANNKSSDISNINICKNNSCLICSIDPLYLKYDYNVYDAEPILVDFEKEHHENIKLSDNVIIKFQDCKIMLEKYNCDQYSNIIVMKIFTSKHSINLDNPLVILQKYLDTLGNYKDNIIYSSEITDKKRRKTDGYWDPYYVFNNIDEYVFDSLVHNISNSDFENNEICEEFRVHNNTNKLCVVGSKLNNLGTEEVKINEPIVINDFKMFIKLQKRLNIGYRNYYNKANLYVNNNSWQAILISIDGNMVTIILSRLRYSIIVSKLGQAVTKEDMSNIVVKIMNYHNVFEKEARPSVYKIDDATKSTWKQSTLCKRSLSTIYLPHDLSRDIKDTMDNFIANEESYFELGITYKLGILLHGPPGTGKTSLVKALANDYDMPIYIIDLNNSGINDDSISDILNSLGETDRYKILLFEDVDCAFVDKEEIKIESKTKQSFGTISISDSNEDNKDKNNKKSTEEQNKISGQTEEKYLTYSGLLNAFDGVNSNQHKVIMIMTTNYKNKLGDALIRPGRIDYSFCVDYCNHEQIVMMATKIIHVLNKNLDMSIDYDSMFNDFANNIITMFNKLNNEEERKGVTPAKLQMYIMKHYKNVDILLNNYDELLK